MQMGRIDVHCHFVPGVDDGCANVGESLTCLRMMVEAGYDRVFCTPHCGDTAFSELSPPMVADLVHRLREEVVAAGIPIELRPGGELRLSAHIARDLERVGVPTYGHEGKYVLTDIWTHDWPVWATRAVEWLQKRGLIVILAHPERLPLLRKDPKHITELAKLGLLFQGNLGPLAGASDSPDIVALAERYLQDGRYFMVGTDGHRPPHMAARLAGLRRVEELVGEAGLRELTERNPGRLWASGS
jgi:protein-tyrosine phosphatase